MEPKIIILAILLLLAAAIFIYVAGLVAAKFTRDRFKCSHCRRRVSNSEKDVFFSDGICKTCGEYLIPSASRDRRN